MNKEIDNVIITAGGIGKRMHSEIPKQFIKIAGRPILMHTIKLFYEYDNYINIILTLPESYKKYWSELCLKYNFNIVHQIISGGSTRFQSIKNALKKTSGNDLTAIHDGVRPLVCTDTIKRCFDSAKIHGNAIAYEDIYFSLRKTKDAENKNVDRNKYKEIQTPQVFKTDIIKSAYNSEYREEFTDDASVLEFSGGEINLVKGNRENIKITTNFDLIIAEAVMNHNIAKQ